MVFLRDNKGLIGGSFWADQLIYTQVIRGLRPILLIEKICLALILLFLLSYLKITLKSVCHQSHNY